MRLQKLFLIRFDIVGGRMQDEEEVFVPLYQRKKKIKGECVKQSYFLGMYFLIQRMYNSFIIVSKRYPDLLKYLLPVMNLPRFMKQRLLF